MTRVDGRASLINNHVKAEGKSMPDAQSQIVGIATVREDSIVDVLQFSQPLRFQIPSNYAGRLANRNSVTELTANRERLKSELAVLFHKCRNRAA